MNMSGKVFWTIFDLFREFHPFKHLEHPLDMSIRP